MKLRTVLCLAVAGIFSGPSIADDFYVIGNGGIYRYAANGQYLENFVPSGTGGMAGAQSFVFGGVDDDLFVADGALGKILVFDGGNGSYKRAIQHGAFGQLYGITLGPDGMLYCTSASGSIVHKVDPASGAYLGGFTSGGSLAQTREVEFGPDGNLYVGDSGNNNVQRFNGTTGAFMNVAGTGGGLNGTDGLAFRPSGNLLACGYYNQSILEYNSTNGAYLSTFAAAFANGMTRPRGLAMGPDGMLYVSDQSAGAVFRYNLTTGAFVDVFASGGALSGPVFAGFGPSQQEVLPTSATPTRGLILAGGIPQLLARDDDYLYMRPGATLVSSDSPVRLVLEGTSPYSTARRVRMDMEFGSSASNIAHTTELYDFTNNQYVLLNQTALGVNDSSLTVTSNTNPSRFIQPGTNIIRARLSCKATGGVLVYPWLVRWDFFRWLVTQ